MKRQALAVAAALALAGSAAATAQTPTTIQATTHRAPSPICLLPSFKTFSAKVWMPKRWERGTPPKSTIVAARRRIGCAPSGHQKAMKRTWARDRHAFNSRRKEMLATRCGSPSCNVRLGWLIAERRGISRSEFDGCLVPLWDRESHWDESVWNEGGSGAGGIPQALPWTKMGSGANPDVGGWEVAREQIKWGLDYLAEVYGGPCGGWSHSNSAGWY